MVAPSYRLLEHTADLGFEVEAGSREELFAAAVLALADVVTPIAALDPRERREIAGAGEDDVGLLHALLEEALFLFETEAFLPARARVRFEDGRALAVLEGERIDLEARRVDRVVKAVTYHGLAIERREGKLLARVILDL